MVTAGVEVMNSLGNLLGQVVDALNALSGGDTWRAMLALAGAGTISMAALQVIKELTPLRRKYQRSWFECWIDSQVRGLEKSMKTSGPKAQGVRVEAAAAKLQVVELATGGLADALYDLQVESMTPQI